MSYIIKVHDDGDVEVWKGKPSLWNTDVVVETLRDVRAALQSYGLDEEEVTELCETLTKEGSCEA